MAFTSWASLYAEALNALANRSWDTFFISKVQNNFDMETTYTRLGNVTAFIDWLKVKKEQEAEGDSGALQFCIGGN